MVSERERRGFNKQSPSSSSKGSSCETNPKEGDVEVVGLELEDGVFVVGVVILYYGMYGYMRAWKSIIPPPYPPSP